MEIDQKISELESKVDSIAITQALLRDSITEVQSLLMQIAKKDTELESAISGNGPIREMSESVSQLVSVSSELVAGKVELYKKVEELSNRISLLESRQNSGIFKRIRYMLFSKNPNS
jgi:chromosome segregation ATPase